MQWSYQMSSSRYNRLSIERSDGGIRSSHGPSLVGFDGLLNEDIENNSHSLRSHCCRGTISSVFCQRCTVPVESDEGNRLERYFNLASSTVESVVAVVVFYWFQYVIHNPTCNFLFKCGCTWHWKGGWKGCNIWGDGELEFYFVAAFCNLGRWMDRAKVSVVHVESKCLVDY